MTTKTTSQDINWLSILRSLTIILVVMNHVRLLNITTGDNYAFIDAINCFFLPFRMPVFIMVSGALLYHTRIHEHWSTKDLYADKLIRIGLPLLVCTLIGNLAQSVFNCIVKHPLPITPASFLSSFVLFNGRPWPHRWYLATLLTMMALYPLYVRLNSRTKSCAMLLGLLLLFPIDFTPLSTYNWFQFFSLNHYILFFYLGILFFQYNLWKWIQPNAHYIAIIMWIIYIVAYLLGITTIPWIADTIPLVQLYCIVMMMSTAMVIDRWKPNCFATIRHYIFPIYLFGIAFQAFVELILWRLLGCPSLWVVPFYLLNILLGIYAPIGISMLIQKIPCRFIHQCFGLKSKKA